MKKIKPLLFATAGLFLAHGSSIACEASKNNGAFNRFQSFQKQKQMPQYNRFQQNLMHQARYQQMSQLNRMQPNYYAQQRMPVASSFNRFQQPQRQAFSFQPTQQRTGMSFNRINPMLQNQLRFIQPTWRGSRINLR